MQRPKKIPAGALQFVLCVGAIIAVLLSTFVLLHHAHHLFDKKTEKVIETIKKADEGLQQAMAQNLPLHAPLHLALGEEGRIAVTVSKSYWGVFERYTVTSTFQKNEFTKTALVGSKWGDTAPALYLKDDNRPLIITGTSKITGNVYVPQQGIRQGSIGGQYHAFTSPVYGTVYQSTTTLPAVVAGLKTHLQQLLGNVGESSGKAVLRLAPHLQQAHSFTAPTQYIYGELLRLSGVRLTGNILLHATTHIVVDADSDLTDVVLIAPKITIKRGFTGSLQAIASQEITIEDQVVLQYPSALVVDKGRVPNAKDRNRPNIAMGKGVTLKGIVAYFDQSETQAFFPQIAIAENTSVYGEVYCEKSLELRGNVLGKVTTAAFIALENGSIYQNHLYKGNINAGTLPLQYAGLLLTEEKTVAKWLY